MVPQFSYLTSAQYYDELRRQIIAAKRGDRISIASLWLRAEDPFIREFVDLLIAASARGVAVTLIVDGYQYLMKDGITPGPAYYYGARAKTWGFKRGIFYERLRAFTDLQAAGVTCAVVNPLYRPFASPFKRRSHIKFTVINNTIFIGGCNLADQDNIDVMIQWNDPKLATWLADFAAKMIKTGSVHAALDGQDQTHAVDAQTSLLIDAGVSHQSVILDRAYKLIDVASKTLLTTHQYFPQGPTAHKLSQAVRRGVTLTAYYNHPSQHKFPLNQVVRLMMLGRSYLDSELRSARTQLPKNAPYLHAKVIASEQVIIISSHNYIYNGVRLATAEIGLVSTNPDLINGIQKALNEQLS